MPTNEGIYFFAVVILAVLAFIVAGIALEVRDYMRIPRAERKP